MFKLDSQFVAKRPAEVSLPGSSNCGSIGLKILKTAGRGSDKNSPLLFCV